MGTFALLALAVVGAIACLALAWRARRGARAGDHPHCRRCDFDLSGAPERAARCPECGGDLTTRRGAPVIGLPRPAWRIVGVELSVAVVCLAVALVAARAADWHAARVRVWPTAWLCEELERGRADFVVADELDRRVQARRIDGELRDRVVSALWRITARARPSVRAGDRLPVATLVAPVPSLPFDDDRARRRRDATFAIEARLIDFRFGEGPWQEYDEPWQRQPLVSIWRDAHELPVPRDLPPGEATLDLMYCVRLVGNGGRSTFVDARPDEPRRDDRVDGRSSFDWQQTIRATTTVLPAGAEDDVALVVDPTLRAAVRASIAFQRIDRGGPARPGAPPATRGLTLDRGRDGEVRASIQFDVQRPPVALAFDVALRPPAGGEEVKVGTLAIPANASHWLYGMSAALPPTLAAWPEPRATVILRPSKDVMRRDGSIASAWGEAIVFDDVPVRRSWVATDNDPTTGESGVPTSRPATTRPQ